MNMRTRREYGYNAILYVTKIIRFLIIFSLSISLFSIITGCDVFDTRDPEEPVGKVEWNYFPITSQQTLENLVYAFNFRENSDKYGSILADDFRFYFDTRDVQDYGLPTHWNRERELNMRGLLNIDLRISLDKIEDKDDLIQSERATYNRDYSIYTADRTFMGSMTLSLRREEDGFWRIYKWEDYRKNNELTWGRLKYEFVPQQ